MADFIEVTHVKSGYTAKDFSHAKETTELLAINIDAIEYVGNARTGNNVISSAKGYIRTRNCDFRVTETYEQLITLINNSSTIAKWQRNENS